ncbi:thioredoxin family protein [Desulfonema ishimotonii]|uniref:Thioredoxin family protein n=1 Tax=Desulfonema ishimotonii TaxID=45657 RepID=A0A401G2G2_9BACT|nr:thioredoxin fold domain-containing protein [Desulfonema ishimotonii]GBC63420.1 thioredoxin family protein [Desulfonema ishimotonii]
MKLRSVFGILITLLLIGANIQTVRADDPPPADKVTAVAPDSPAIRWYAYQEGIDRGKHEKKKVFINFYADWCRYCKVMEQKTFKDDGVIAYLNDNFISVRVNSDKNKKLAADYNITGLPLSWFVSEAGENIGSQPGYIPPNMLLPLLKYIHTDSYKTMNFKKFMENEKA